MAMRAWILFAGASFGAMASSAFAQTATTDAAAQSQTDSSSSTPSAADIIVTGSRIVRDGYQSATPVTVAPTAELQKTVPASIPDALNQLPVFQGSTSAHNIVSPVAISTGNYLNLRNFGIVRTLILQDGHRMPPTDYSGQVDTNIIPQLLIQRVDVVTGGASAVYGSDAVTGVVNFVLDKDFTGVKALAQGSMSKYGDSKAYRIGAAAGGDLFGGRGHFLLSAERYENHGIQAADRKFENNRPTMDGAGTAASPFRLVTGVNYADRTDGGLVISGPFAGQQFLSNGQLAPFVPGRPLELAGLAYGGDGGYYDGQIANAPLKTTQGFGRVSIDLSDNVSAYAQMTAAQSSTSYISAIFNFSGATALRFFSDNAYLPADAAAQLTAAGVNEFRVNRLSNDINNRYSIFNQKTRSLVPSVGLNGTLFDKFKWELYYTHGDSRTNSVLPTNINFGRFYAASDAVRDPGGNIVCRTTLTNPGLYPGCVPLNLFGSNVSSQAALDYISGRTWFKVKNKQDDIAGSIAGDLFDLWAGPVSAAFSAEYRKQSLLVTSNADPLAVADFSGLRNIPAGQSPTGNWAFPTVAPQRGSNDVKEAALELQIPLMRNKRFFDNLEVNLAARYTKYATGPVATWKAGLIYNPFGDLRLRYVESRDIRAPTLFDLYAGRSAIQANINDVHTNQNVVISVISSGNPDLRPEVSRTTTFGAVYSPSWLPGFTISADYYHIRIGNAIGSVSGNDPVIQAQCEESGGTSPVCDTIIRPGPFSDRSPANAPTLLLSRSLNIATQFQKGLDVESSYSHDFGRFGRWSERVLFNYMPVQKFKSFDSSPLVNSAGTPGNSKYSATIFTGWTLGCVDLNLQSRYSGPLSRGTNGVYATRLPSIWFHDLYAGYQFGEQKSGVTVFMTVSNLFNKQPRVSPGTQYAGVPGLRPTTNTVAGDDIVGRYFTIGARANF